MRTLSLCAGPDGAELAVQVRTSGGRRLLRQGASLVIPD